MNYITLSLLLLAVSLMACQDPNVVQTYWQNGQVKEKRFYSPNYDREEGRYKIWQYDELGQLLAEGEMVLGKKDGEWKDYHPNGEIKFKGFYKLGKKFGRCTSYFENGQLQLEVEFNDHEQLEGTYASWNEKGALIQRGTYADGKPIGKWTNQQLEEGTLRKDFYYDSSGGKLEEWIEDSANVYRYTRYWRSGGVDSLGRIKDDPNSFELDSLKDGIWKHYNTNGDLAWEGKFVLGKPAGLWKWYNPKGELVDTEFYKVEEGSMEE
ncbi:MAG: hypothetical protein AAFY71_15755 [Bacteroidota bacterium]